MGRDAVLEAAWENSAAEQQAVVTVVISKGNRRRGDQSSRINREELDNDHVVEATNSSGGYRASNIFQSVMI